MRRGPVANRDSCNRLVSEGHTHDVGGLVAFIDSSRALDHSTDRVVGRIEYSYYHFIADSTAIRGVRRADSRGLGTSNFQSVERTTRRVDRTDGSVRRSPVGRRHDGHGRIGEGNFELEGTRSAFVDRVAAENASAERVHGGVDYGDSLRRSVDGHTVQSE